MPPQPRNRRSRATHRRPPSDANEAGARLVLALEALVERIEEQNELLRCNQMRPPAPIGPALVDLLRDYLARQGYRR